MQFDIENHFYTMMERLCMYIDETNDTTVEELQDRLEDNVIARDIIMFATSVGSIEQRVTSCFDFIRKEYKHSSETTICSIINTIMVTVNRIEHENVSRIN